MINDVEHFFIYLLAICISLKKYLFGSCIHCKLDFFKKNYISSLYLLHINLLTKTWFENIVSYRLVFILLIISFARQKFFSLLLSHSFIFAFVAYVTWHCFQKFIVKTNVKWFFSLCFLLLISVVFSFDLFFDSVVVQGYVVRFPCCFQFSSFSLVIGF